MELESIGWDAFFADAFAKLTYKNVLPGRAASEHGKGFEIWTSDGPVAATIAGRLRHNATGRGELPAVGDWVALALASENRGAVIHAVLPRRSAFRRMAAGTRVEEQVLAANIDTVFLVTGLDGDFNLRRIERYLTVAWDGGARPVVVLNKADVCDELEDRIAEVEGVSPGVDVVAVSATKEGGLERLDQYLDRGRTIALLGSSGVGKSTITNHLLGDDSIATAAVRGHDSRGKHTTTFRATYVLPSGALLIDTPGMRELQVWTTGSGLEAAFEDIEEIAAGCHFSDCRHRDEPGCAVVAAIESGALDPARFQSYRSLEREIRHNAVRQDVSLGIAEKQRVKAINRSMRNFDKRR